MYRIVRGNSKGVVNIIEEVQIKDEYITIGQLLKLVNIVGSGGEVKTFLNDFDVYVNTQKHKCTQRGKKLYPGDVVTIDGEERIKYKIIN